MDFLQNYFCFPPSAVKPARHEISARNEIWYNHISGYIWTISKGELFNQLDNFFNSGPSNTSVWAYIYMCVQHGIDLHFFENLHIFQKNQILHSTSIYFYQLFHVVSLTQQFGAGPELGECGHVHIYALPRSLWKKRLHAPFGSGRPHTTVKGEITYMSEWRNQV